MEKKSAVFWRNEIRKLFGPLAPSDDTQLYERVKEEHLSLKEADDINKAKGTKQNANLNLFLSSVALFSFGHVEVIDDILDNIPEQSNARAARRILVDLLPSPFEEFDLYKFQSWLKDYKTMLIWSEEEGRFLLKS